MKERFLIGSLIVLWLLAIVFSPVLLWGLYSGLEFIHAPEWVIESTTFFGGVILFFCLLIPIIGSPQKTPMRRGGKHHRGFQLLKRH